MEASLELGAEATTRAAPTSRTAVLAVNQDLDSALLSLTMEPVATEYPVREVHSATAAHNSSSAEAEPNSAMQVATANSASAILSDPQPSYLSPQARKSSHPQRHQQTHVE